jgi:hypothetical protein
LQLPQSKKRAVSYQSYLRFRLQRSLQYFTFSQFLAHFFRQVKGFPQTGQVLVGRFSFLLPIGGSDHCFSSPPTTNDCAVGVSFLNAYLFKLLTGSMPVFACQLREEV